MSRASPSDAIIESEYEEQITKLPRLDEDSILHPKTPMLTPQERGCKLCGYAPRTTPDYGQTTIQRHLREGFYDPAREVRGERNFRERYRIPTAAYEELRREILEAAPHLDGSHQQTCRRRDHHIPVDNKLLSVLRVFGRGMTVFDDVDHSGMSPESIRHAVKDVARVVSQNLFEKYVHPPRTFEEIQAAMALYDEIGLPGCFGSMDATHLLWDRSCPHAVSHSPPRSSQTAWNNRIRLARNDVETSFGQLKRRWIAC